MKKLKLTDMSKHKIEKDQMVEIKGGWPFCWIGCNGDNCNWGRMRKADRKGNS